MWIDTIGKRRPTVLGEHTGENVGSIVIGLLKEYNIGGDLIGYYMLDNASSNDTAVEFILKESCPWRFKTTSPSPATLLRPYNQYLLPSVSHGPEL